MSDTFKVTAKHVNFYYGDFKALHDITLDFKTHQVTALIGDFLCLFSCDSGNPEISRRQIPFRHGFDEIQTSHALRIAAQRFGCPLQICERREADSLVDGSLG